MTFVQNQEITMPENVGSVTEPTGLLDITATKVLSVTLFILRSTGVKLCLSLLNL